MPIVRQKPDASKFNRELELPYSLRLVDFELVMQDIYDFFHDVNAILAGKGLKRLDDMLRPAAMSGIISDMVTASAAQHSRTLVENRFHNGHPALVLNGVYPNDAVQSGKDGVEIKSARKPGQGNRLNNLLTRLHFSESNVWNASLFDLEIFHALPPQMPGHTRVSDIF